MSFTENNPNNFQENVVLSEENKMLKEQLDKKEDLFKYVIQVNDKYKRLIEYQGKELHRIKKS